MNSILSIDDKLKKMGFEKSKPYLSSVCVNVMYSEWIEHNKSEIVLDLINKLLEKAKYNKINKFEEFKMIVSDLKNMDPIEFITENKHTLDEICDLEKDLNYDLKDKRKNYIVVFLKNLMKLVDYKMEFFISKQILDGIPKTITKYRLVKLNEYVNN